MPTNVHFVFSNPPGQISDAEYSDWYDQHVREILEVQGFAEARRYWLSPVVGERPPTMYRHLSLYLIEGDPRAALAALAQQPLTLPEWFGQIRFASFDGLALEDLPVRLSDHAYLVFSTPPARIAFDAYSDWYATHLRENVAVDGFDAGWRFRLEPDTVDPAAECDASHAALYEVSAELAALRRGLAEAREAGRVHFPTWFGEIGFASLDCVAASARIEAPVRT